MAGRQLLTEEQWTRLLAPVVRQLSSSLMMESRGEGKVGQGVLSPGRHLQFTIENVVAKM